MTPPQPAFPQRAKKSPSPAERSEEFAETQRRLKQEAAERRVQSAASTPPRSGSGKRRARG